LRALLGGGIQYISKKKKKKKNKINDGGKERQLVDNIF